MRDYAGFIETRQTLLHLKASNRNNWISFAIAHHLNKDYDLAVQVRLYDCSTALLRRSHLQAYAV